MPMKFSGFTITLDRFAPKDAWVAVNEKKEPVFVLDRDELMMKYTGKGKGIAKELICGERIFFYLKDIFSVIPDPPRFVEPQNEPQNVVDFAPQK